MNRLAVIDGAIVAPEDAKVSVYDRGFLYGDSVFETVRTYGGKLYALDEHLARLEDSAHKIGMELPVSRETLAKETELGIGRVRRGVQNPESTARIMVTRGTGPLGLDTALAERALRVILVEPLKPPPPSHYAKGISAWCVETVRASDAAESAKVGNYLASALALRKARDAGAVEALVVNREGLVVEGTTANVFAVVCVGPAATLVTPPLERGILAGITRRHVLELAEKEHLPVEERAMSRDEILRSDELFLTSSIRELLPVVRVDDHTIGSGLPGPVTQRLHRLFRRLVGMDGLLPHEVEGVDLEET